MHADRQEAELLVQADEGWAEEGAWQQTDETGTWEQMEMVTEREAGSKLGRQTNKKADRPAERSKQ